MTENNFDKWGGENSRAVSGRNPESENPVIWGTVCDDGGNLVQDSLIRLLQYADDGDTGCIIIGETYSDCNGNYKIQLPSSDGRKYRIEVSAPCCGRDIQNRKNSICYY